MYVLVCILVVQDCLHSCHEQIELLLANTASKRSSASEPCNDLSLMPAGAGGSRGAAATPTDAMDVLLAN